MFILKYQHGIYGYNFLDICHVYLDRGCSKPCGFFCLEEINGKLLKV